jgi:hypothetical protein
MDNDAIDEIVQSAQKLAPVEPYYSIYFYVMWIFSTSVTIVTIYIVMFKRQVKMQAEFRPLVFHTKVASALVLTGATLWQPVTVPAYFGGYALGPLARFGQNGYLIGQWFTCKFLFVGL